MVTNTRERILEQAIELFYLHGFTEASVRDLAKALGITQASIYNHFKSKHDVLFTIMDRLGNSLVALLKETEEQFEDPVLCLAEMIHRHLCMLTEKKREFRIFVDELNRLPKPLEKYCSIKHRQIFEIYRIKIEEINANKMSDSLDSTTTAFSILGVIIWFYRWIKEDGRLSIEGAADEIVKLLFNGILSRDFRRQLVGGCGRRSCLQEPEQIFEQRNSADQGEAHGNSSNYFQIVSNEE